MMMRERIRRGCCVVSCVEECIRRDDEGEEERCRGCCVVCCLEECVRRKMMMET